MINISLLAYNIMYDDDGGHLAVYSEIILVSVNTKS